MLLSKKDCQNLTLSRRHLWPSMTLLFSNSSMTTEVSKVMWNVNVHAK